MNLKSIATFILLMLIYLQSSHAQTSKVSGNVEDDTGVPLAGASIVVKGTTKGTVTDFDGNFAIEARSDAVLIISYLGFLTEEMALNGQTNISITMVPDAASLDEVVLVGYGQVKKVI